MHSTLRREGDALWKLLHKNGSFIYIYLLLEFQSTVDPWMAVRLLLYVALLYQHLIQENQLQDGRLPPVFPIVLYNGKPRWTAATRLKELIALPEDSPLNDFQVSMGDHLIDEIRYSKETLISLESVLAFVIRMEQANKPEEAQGILTEMAQLLDSPGLSEVKRSLVAFLTEAGSADKLGMGPINFREFFEGGHSMIAENFHYFECLKGPFWCLSSTPLRVPSLRSEHRDPR